MGTRGGETQETERESLTPIEHTKGNCREAKEILYIYN